MKNIFKYLENSLDLIYRLIFYISFISIICVVSFIIGIIYINYETNNSIIVGMLPALGITLSALLASTSLMKSIQNTNRIEKIKKQNELELKKNKISFYFKIIQSYIRMYVVDFKMIIDDDLLNDFKIKLEEYLKLILNDNDIKALNDYEIQKYIIFMELNINYTTRYLDKKDYPKSKEELMEVIEDSYYKMYLELQSLGKKYNINFESAN